MLHFCSCTPISFRLNPKSLPCQNLERFGRAMAKADLIVRIALTCSTAFQAAVHRRCCPALQRLLNKSLTEYAPDCTDQYTKIVPPMPSAIKHLLPFPTEPPSLPTIGFSRWSGSKSPSSSGPAISIPVQEGKDVTGSVFQKQATSGPSQTAALETWGHPGESDKRTRSSNSMWTEAYRGVEDFAGSTVLLAKMDDLFDLFFA